ncbi:MAG: flavodoxin domain-containing protein [Chloroflexota bacterium]
MSQTKRLGRREFLILGATTLGGAAWAALRQPEIKMDEYTCALAENSQTKILVAYGSRYGATAGVASAIAEALCKTGVAADAKHIASVTDLSAYDAAIIGAPVNSDEWMSEVVEFVGANRSQLSQMPVAYFLTCMTLGLTNQPEAREKIAAVLQAVEKQIPEVKPLDKGLFAGALDYGKMSVAMQMMYRAFAEDGTSGDFRDWDAIRAWGGSVGIKLLASS